VRPTKSVQRSLVGPCVFSHTHRVTRNCSLLGLSFSAAVLGLTYDHALDMWSVGCCLYELYTGKMLFPGRNNNDMLRLHIELKGPFPRSFSRR